MSTVTSKGLTSRQQAFLVGLAFALAASGTITTFEGMTTNTEWKEIIGVVAVLGGIASGAIKEGLGVYGVSIPGTPGQAPSSLKIH